MTLAGNVSEMAVWEPAVWTVPQGSFSIQLTTKEGGMVSVERTQGSFTLRTADSGLIANVTLRSHYSRRKIARVSTDCGPAFQQYREAAPLSTATAPLRAQCPPCLKPARSHAWRPLLP